MQANGATSGRNFRLLLTDSGHYLLPVDDPRELSRDTVSEAVFLSFLAGNVSGIPHMHHHVRSKFHNHMKHRTFSHRPH